MTTIQTLAADMKASPADVLAFVSALKVWTDKGYTVEQAIEQNARVISNLLKSATRLVSGEARDVDYAFKSLVADQIWQEVRK